MTTKEILDSLRVDFVSSVDLYFKPVTAVVNEFKKAVCDTPSAPTPQGRSPQSSSLKIKQAS